LINPYCVDQPHASGDAQLFSDDTVIQGLSTFMRIDGTTGAAADVTFAYYATPSPAAQQQLSGAQNFADQLVNGIPEFGTDSGGQVP